MKSVNLFDEYDNGSIWGDNNYPWSVQWLINLIDRRAWLDFNGIHYIQDRSSILRNCYASLLSFPFTNEQRERWLADPVGKQIIQPQVFGESEHSA